MDITEPLRFDRFELLTQRRTLLRDGQPVPLRGRAFDLLVALVQRAGQVVTRNELLDTVWRGLVVEDNNVAMQVTALRKALQAQLIATVPGRGYCFTGRLHAESAEPSPCPAAPPALASDTRLFGRDEDLADIEKALTSARCVTLAGPSGVGKTALATALRERWNRATGWVDLTPLESGGSVWPMVCRELGQQMPAGDPINVLGGSLRGLDLLVFDNAEHLVVEVGSIVEQVLAAAPGLRVLVTSQVPLRIPSERVRRIEPLTLPDEATSGQEALAHGAVAMLVDRVRAADPRFAIDERSLPLLCRLCAALDGLPLALEMAAARVPLMGLQAVHDALSQRFSMLRRRENEGAARRRTLQAAIDWSYSLLPVEEQQLLRALGVFAGGFGIDLAALLMAPASHERWDVIDRLAALVERSLVACDHGDPPRYRLLESTRSHALIKLKEAGEEGAVRAAHAAAMTAFMKSMTISEHHNVSNEAFGPARREVDNLRVALEWAMLHDKTLAVRLSVEAALPMILFDWRHEALEWMSTCEPLVDDPEVPTTLQRDWRRVFAMQMMWIRDARTAEAARRSLMLSRTAGDDWNHLWSLVALVRSKDVADEEMMEGAETIRQLTAAHPQWLLRIRSHALGALAWAAFVQQDFATCLALREEAADLAGSSDSARMIDFASVELAEALWLAGRATDALERLSMVLRPPERGADTIVVRAHLATVRILFDTARFEESRAAWPALVLRGRRFGLEAAELAVFGAAKMGHLRTAALLLGHLSSLYARHGRAGNMSPVGDVARAKAIVLQHVDKKNFDLLVYRGRPLLEGQADALLLADDDAPAASDLDRWLADVAGS